MRLPILLTLLLLPACAPESPRFNTIDPRLLPLIESIEGKLYRYTGERIEVDVPIGVVPATDLGKGKRGKCKHYNKRNPLAPARREIWIADWMLETANDWQLEALLLHEIGHCLLGRGHYIEKFTANYPRSIMYPDSSLVGNFLKDNEPYYYRELLTGIFNKGLEQ